MNYVVKTAIDFENNCVVLCRIFKDLNDKILCKKNYTHDTSLSLSIVTFVENILIMTRTLTKPSTEEKTVIAVAKNYVKAFKEVDTELVDTYFSPQCTKLGYFYDFEEDKWMDKAMHNFKEIKDWCAIFNVKKQMPDTDIQIELLDLQDKIAIVKVEAEWVSNKWGCDYVLLTKDTDKWLIESIIWQSVV